MSASKPDAAGTAEATSAGEVDESLLEWFGGLSVIERLRSASRNAAVLERMARAAAADR